MPEATFLAHLPVGSVVAPAGHGKTEMIAKAAALGRRTLILTHTHAGVHAIRARLKRLGIAHNAAAVDTIAGWATRYAGAFPGRGQPPKGIPKGDEWNQVYRGGLAVLDVSVVRRVVEASYDRVLIDEYQDCDALQHKLALGLAKILPTIVFGDPMQGIFEFSQSMVRWESDVFPEFPLQLELEVPRRWEGTEPELGQWIADVRDRLSKGQPVDLDSGPVRFIPCGGAFEMDVFFDGYDDREGSVAAIHCRRPICNNLAKATKGAYQSIEEIAASRLQQFGAEWDSAQDGAARDRALRSLIGDCLSVKSLADGESDSQDDHDLRHQMSLVSGKLIANGEPIAAISFLRLVRKHSRSRTHRGELARDAERALVELDGGRVATLSEATVAVRQRLSLSGRGPQKRTISTPLLLKGLEFDHVVIPDAAHFQRESYAAAKLFYVAISRARHSLTISSSQRVLQFPLPNT